METSWEDKLKVLMCGVCVCVSVDQRFMLFLCINSETIFYTLNSSIVYSMSDHMKDSFILISTRKSHFSCIFMFLAAFYFVLRGLCWWYMKMSQKSTWTSEDRTVSTNPLSDGVLIFPSLFFNIRHTDGDLPPVDCVRSAALQHPGH